jgi:hypothetical protein
MYVVSLYRDLPFDREILIAVLRGELLSDGHKSLEDDKESYIAGIPPH